MNPCPQWTQWLALAPEEVKETGQAQALEMHVASCANCRQLQSVYAGVRVATRASATRLRAPVGLRERILAGLEVAPEAALERPGAVSPGPRSGVGTRVGEGVGAGADAGLRAQVGPAFWLGLAGGWLAAGALACALAVSLLLGPLPWRAQLTAPQLALADPMAAYIDNHARALVTHHVTDVDSSSRHTVKPWFIGRLDYAPLVADLAPQGYPLLGGRLEYVERHSVAVLVYQRRQHLIDVYVWPAADAAVGAPGSALANAAASAAESAPTKAAADDPHDALGYHSATGNAGGWAFVAVSDLDRAELGDLARAFAQSLQNQSLTASPQ